ncbi:hypothetical protein [Micromonospora sp. 067-2]|uniref:hypothetical protein n=1 Tax=Micromonospora sp. 067-2 TaxID=2789270 RepID=UPI00397A624C
MASPSGAAGAMSVRVWDVMLCAALLAGWLLVVLLIALARGARDVSLVPGRLAPWHYLLATLAVAVYVVTAVLGVPETPGHIWARATRVGHRHGDLSRVVQLLVPTLVVTVVVALIAGVTVPLPPSAATSAAPRGDEVPPARTAPTTEAASTPSEVERPTATEVLTPTPGDDPDTARRAQAEVVNTLLEESVASRGDLATAIAAVGECRDLSRAVALLEGVTRQRLAQRDQAQALTIDAFADGPAMRGYLVSAFAYSGDADAAYAAWARHSISSGCSLDANWRRGNQLSERSQTAKGEFLRRWNPIASSCGLPVRTTKDI